MTDPYSIILDPNHGRSTYSSVADWIFVELWRRIVMRQLEPNSRVTEEGLAELLEVSRTPLREALRRLQEANLIQRNRNRVLRVTPLSIEEVVELTMIRERLEGLIAYRVTDRVRDEGISLASVREILGQMEALQATRQGPAAVLKAGISFHWALYELSGCERARTMLSSTLLSLERYRYLLNENQHRPPGILSEHTAIVDAIESGDPDAAEAAMRYHVRSSRALYIEQLMPLLDGLQVAD